MKEFPAILLIVCIEFTSVVLYGVARSVIESPSFVPNISALLYTVLAVKVSNIIRLNSSSSSSFCSSLVVAVVFYRLAIDIIYYN